MKIKNRHSLNLLLKKKRIKNIEFKLSHLTEEDNKTWLKKITKDYYACGCQTGTAFLMAGLILTGFYFGWRMINDPSYRFHTGQLIYVAVFLFISSIAGKLLGLYISHSRLKKNVDHLMRTCSN